MKRLLLALVVIMFFSAAAVACTCDRSIPVCAAFARAEAVFVGEVTRVESARNGKGQTAHVKVEEVFKGLPARDDVFRSYGDDCDVVYREGQRWLFYAVYHED